MSAPLHILLIEDDDVDRLSIYRELQHAAPGIRITEAADGATGISAIGSTSFDCALVDLNLPDMSGFDLLRRIPGYPDLPLPVVLLTGIDIDEVGMLAIANGVQDYLIKGEFNGHLLIRSIRYAIERKKLHTALLQHERDLFCSERKAMVGTMLAGLAHNMNNPLSIISLTLQSLQRRDGLPETLSAGFSTIEKQIERIALLVRDMTYLTRDTVGRLQPVALGQLMGRALERVSTMIEGTAITLACDPVPDTWITVDQAELELALIYVLHNAIDALGESQGRIDIAFRQEEFDRIRIMISDSGRGMSRQIASKVFDPFFTTKDGIAARGLSMSVVERIVVRNGGAIDLHSTEGRGTVVAFIFQSVRPAADDTRIVIGDTAHALTSAAPAS